jgi:small subunit ribosomal protein S2
MSENGIWENLKKKETARLTKEKDQLLRDLGGIREMRKHPNLIYVIDPKKEEIAVKEARKLNIPVVGLVDTNCDPDVVDFPIPGNDDALKSIKFITNLIAQSVVDGRKEFMMGSVKKADSAVEAKADEGAGAPSA